MVMECPLPPTGPQIVNQTAALLLPSGPPRSRLLGVDHTRPEPPFDTPTNSSHISYTAAANHFCLGLAPAFSHSFSSRNIRSDHPAGIFPSRFVHYRSHAFVYTFTHISVFHFIFSRHLTHPPEHSYIHSISPMSPLPNTPSHRAMRDKRGFTTLL